MKLEHLFAVQFSEKSSSVLKDSLYEWIWHDDAIVYLKRQVKKVEKVKIRGKLQESIATVEEMLPMATVLSVDAIDTDGYTENWKSLGFVGSLKDKAKESLIKFVKREVKENGLARLVGTGYVNKTGTVMSLVSKFQSANVSQDSAKRYLAAILSSESQLLGKDYDRYFDLPTLECLAIQGTTEDEDKAAEAAKAEAAKAEAEAAKADLAEAEAARLAEAALEAATKPEAAKAAEAAKAK